MDARKHLLLVLFGVVAFLAAVEAGKYRLHVSVNMDTILQNSKRTRHKVLKRNP
jgi:hypothetical protein